MKSQFSTVFQRLADTPPSQSFDVFGGIVEFISWSEEFCVLRGTVPAGSHVALHSHPDAEDFYIVSGTQQVLVQGEGGELHWRDSQAGDYVRVPGDTPHAWRNTSSKPAVDLIVTTARLGRFFAEVGRPVTDGMAPPTPEEVANFARCRRSTVTGWAPRRRTLPSGCNHRYSVHEGGGVHRLA